MNFTGKLNTNEFYNALYNAYRLYFMYADNLAGMDRDTLADRYRSDGGMYHDQNLFTDMDVLYSRVWDPNDTNVLAPEAVVAPKQQVITVDQFRQIGLYTDEYLSRRAWMDPTNYDQFRTVVQKQVVETKRVFEQRLVDTYVGTYANGGAQAIELTWTAPENAEEANRIQAMEIARAIGDLYVELRDTTNKYNNNGFIKAFAPEDIDIIWNGAYYNQIRYVDLPTIFHKDELLTGGKVLAPRYFGTVEAGGTADGTTIRAMEEYFIPVNGSNEYTASGATNVTHVFPGDILPSGTPLTDAGAGSEAYADMTTQINGVNRAIKVCTKAFGYRVNDKIICKLAHRNGVKYLSSFETSTEFWNPKNLTTNRYLTWAYARPEALDGYPYITLTDGN